MSKDKRNEDILSMFNDGVKQKVIADKFGISTRTIQRIINENKVDVESTTNDTTETRQDSTSSSKKKYSLIKIGEGEVATSDNYLDFEEVIGTKFSSGRLASIERNLSEGIVPRIKDYELITNDISDTVEKTKNQLEQEIKDLKYVLNEVVGVLSDKDILPYYVIQKIKDKI